MGPIDYFLNRTSPYRLLLNGLWILAGISLVETFLGWLAYTPIDLILSLALLLFTARVTNSLCVLFTRATPAPESASITALLLFFILTPLQSASDALFFIIAAALAIISKYAISYGRRAVFNPAAFAVFVLSVAGSSLVSWWVATTVLLPFVLILGFFVVRKTKQGKLFWIFAVTAFVVGTGKSMLMGAAFLPSASALLTIFPLIFFGTLMLTDPQTMPASEGKRGMYAFLVGLLFPLSFSFTGPFGTFAGSPELALLVGNAYAFAFDVKKRASLSFHGMTKLSRDLYEFAFVANPNLPFQSGQYVEVTAPHSKVDNRGTRRYFSISSPPADHFLRLTARIPVESSTFKDTLRDLKKGNELSALGPYGAFVLPKDPNQKILAIAGGVGIAPFMSIFRHLAQQHERRDVVLIYTADTPLDFAYQEEIDSIKGPIGLKVIYLPTDFSELSGWEGPSGFITSGFIEKEIRDYKKRCWYIAGADSFVQSQTELTRALSIDSVKKESFSGF
jgi:glycine betaine catabolism B